MILAPLQKLRNNVGDLSEIILATIFKWLPKVQKIAQSGHTGPLILIVWTLAKSARQLKMPLERLID